jgi:hypothetical protein
LSEKTSSEKKAKNENFENFEKIKKSIFFWLLSTFCYKLGRVRIGKGIGRSKLWISRPGHREVCLYRFSYSSSVKNQSAVKYQMMPNSE